MRWPTLRPSPRVATASALAFVLVVVALVVHQPHWNPFTERSYRFPVHADEYVHWGYARAVQTERTVVFGSPFGGSRADEFSLATHLHERGFAAYLGAFQGVTGVSWLVLFEWAPSLMAVLLAAAAFLVAKRWGAGVAAAALVAAIPTTLRFLGPGFLVPIAFSLPLVVLGIYLVLEAKDAWAFPALAVVCAALWTLHAMAAVALLGVVALDALRAARASPRRAVALVGLVAALLVVGFPYYGERLARGVGASAQISPAPEMVLAIGWPLLVLSACGAALLAWTDARGALLLALPLAACEAVVLTGLALASSPFGLYDRTVAILHVLAALVAAVALARLVAFAASRWRPLAGGHTALASCVVLALLVSAPSVATQAKQDYYALLSEETYARYLDAGAWLAPTHGYAAVDSLDTMPFTILTGFAALHNAFPGSGAPPPEVVRFFRAGSADTAQLERWSATVVVTQQAVTNPDLVEVLPGIYELKPDIVDRMPVTVPRAPALRG